MAYFLSASLNLVRAVIQLAERDSPRLKRPFFIRPCFGSRSPLLSAWLFALFLGFLIIWPASAPAEEAPARDPLVVAGVMDLRHHKFSATRTLTLDGEWEYYAREFLSPSELSDRRAAGRMETMAYATVPMFFPVDESGYPFSYGTFRARFLLPSGRTYALEIPNQDSAHVVFLDGILIARDGLVGTDRASSVPSRRTTRYYWTPTREETEIVVQVSNFHHYKGGFHNQIRIGLPEVVNARRQTSVVLAFFFLGAFLMIGLYNLVTYFFRRRVLYNLWFAFLCFTFAARSLVIDYADITMIFPGAGWNTITRGGFLLFVLLLPLFLSYIQALFPGTVPRVLRFGLYAFSSGLALLILLPWTLPFYAKYLNDLYMVVLYLITALITIRLFHSFYKGRREAGLFGLSFVFLLFMLFNPYIFLLFLPECSYESATMSFMVFVMFQAVLIGLRVGQAYRRLDILALDLENQVRQRTAELETANGALRERDNERGFFLMSLSHEVRTPMTIILNYLNRLEYRHPDDRDIDLVRQNLDRIFKDMVNIFDMLRLEKGKMAIAANARLDLADELATIADFYRPHAEAAGLSLGLELEAGLKLDISPRAFNRMCGNYLENAIRYTDRGGRIRILAKNRDGRIYLRIENSGPLIQIDEPNKLFIPFLQLHPGKGGAGLGLYLVAEMAKHAGGRAGFELRDGWNSFYIDLPSCLFEPGEAGGLLTGAAVASALAAAAAPVPALEAAGLAAAARAVFGGGFVADGTTDTVPASPPLISDKLVLLVDDDKTVRSLLISALHPRYLIRTARNGRDAMALLTGGLAPDLIVSDVMMDELDGFGLLRELDAADASRPQTEAGEATPKIPILFVTGMTDAEDRLPESDERLVRVMMKPFSDQQLANTVAEIIQAAY